MKEYGLDLIDRKILYHLDLDSRITFKDLGKKLKVAKETVRFRIKRLEEQGFIKSYLSIIHPSYLNRYHYKLFYKFHKTTPQKEKEIIEFIKNYKSTSYLASLEGRYDVVFLLLAKNLHDLYNFLKEFRSSFGEYILEQEILTVTSIHRFNYRFFYDGGKIVHMKYPENLIDHDIDELDYQIIKILASNARISLIELAKQTNSETNVVKYRINKLKTVDILGKHVLEVNFEKFGLQHIQIDIYLKDHKNIKQIVEYASQISNFTFGTVTLGKYDLAFELVVQNMEELRNILDGIKEKFSQDITDQDVFIMKEHRINWFPYTLEPAKTLKTPTT
jgi:Lrp/AsnC family transcriptional regulator, regulator for asnA, asnC and gidA